MDETFTLSDLEKLSGAKRRSIQLWAERGAIIAEPGTEGANTGTHRQFSKTEAMIACLLHPFALRQMSIGELVKVGDALRNFLANKRARADIEIAMLRPDTPLYLMVNMSIKGRGGRAALVSLGPNVTADDAFAAVVNGLDKPESMTHVIKVNTYLRGTAA